MNLSYGGFSVNMEYGKPNPMQTPDFIKTWWLATTISSKLLPLLSVPSIFVSNVEEAVKLLLFLAGSFIIGDFVLNFLKFLAFTTLSLFVIATAYGILFMIKLIRALGETIDQLRDEKDGRRLQQLRKLMKQNPFHLVGPQIKTNSKEDTYL